MSPRKTSGMYASGTDVPTSRSRAEIERVLERYGADAFAYGRDGRKASLMFRADGRHVQFTVAVPEDDPAEERRLWRCLVLSIKSKLEVVASGIETFEDAFLAHVVLPDGTPIGKWMGPQIARAYELGEMPALLPGSSS